MILKNKRRAFIGAGNFLTRTPLPSAPFRKNIIAGFRKLL